MVLYNTGIKAQAPTTHVPLAFPFSNISKWQILSGGNNGAYHGGFVNDKSYLYALYAIDFARLNGNTGNEVVYAPTSGWLRQIVPKPSKCVYLSIAELSDEEDVYIELCHFNLNPSYREGNWLKKGQDLGTVATDGCSGHCDPAHIHMAVFIGKHDNPWRDPKSRIPLPFLKSSSPLMGTPLTRMDPAIDIHTPK